jgi:tRNA(Ile)-lysidine synthase
MVAGLLQQIRRTVRREALLPPGTKVLIALSGGSDSVALTCILVQLAATDDFSVAGVAHFNHQLRDTAERDEVFCRDLATRLGLEFRSDRADVAAYASAQRLSVEDAARRLRYAFLRTAAADLFADRIAVGHTLDDQAETVLLKMVRGAGLTGLGGISPQKGDVVRPLLEVSKRDLTAYLTSVNAPWLEDETNQDLSNPRNRLRHVVLPSLDETYSGASRAIARAGELMRMDAQWLDARAAELFDAVAETTESGVQLDARRLATEPRPIVRRVLLTALRAIAGNREIGLDHIRLTEDVLGRSCGGTDVPGGRVELRREKLVLSQQGLR